jgi:hypothetical protein
VLLTMHEIPVVKLAEAAAILGVSGRAAESALRHAGIKSGYPRAAVEWLAANRPGQGARTDLRQEDSVKRVQIEYWTGPSDRPTGHGWVTVNAAPPAGGDERRQWARQQVAASHGMDASEVRLLAIYEGTSDPDAENGLADANWRTEY